MSQIKTVAKQNKTHLILTTTKLLN